MNDSPTENEAMLAEIMSRPSEFCLDAIPNEVENSVEHFKQINQLLGRDDIAAKMITCERFHHRCRQYQVANDISGLSLYKISVGNLSVEFWSEYGSLEILDRNIPDYVILSLSTNVDPTISSSRYFKLKHRDNTRFPEK